MICAHVVLGDQMPKSPQSPNDDVWGQVLCFQLVLTIPERETSEVARDPERWLRETNAQLFEFNENLMGKLSCADCHDAVMSQILAIAFWSQHIENGQNVNCGLSCSGLSLAKDVAFWAGHDLWYDLILDLAGKGKTELLYALHKLGPDGQISPFNILEQSVQPLCDSVWLD